MEKLLKRINPLLKAKLNLKSFFTAINIWAIPSVDYSTGKLNWSATELREIDENIRTTLTEFEVTTLMHVCPALLTATPWW